MQTVQLQRETFKTNRLLEFCSEKELVAQMGHPPSVWPVLILQEAADNSLDECEEAGIAPDILIRVDTKTGAISIRDNGRGIPSDTVAGVIDFTVRASSREAYCSPSRGAQGNALMGIVSMGFALTGTTGRVQIDARGLSHRIEFSVDHLRQQPTIRHHTDPIPAGAGTTITVFWPNSASSILAAAKPRFVQIAADFGWLNPHLRLALIWDGEVLVEADPTDTGFTKWRPSYPTSAHWYDLPRFERYIAALVALDEDAGRKPARTIRDFVADLDGLSRSTSQKKVLDDTSMHRLPLSSLYSPEGKPDLGRIAELLRACQNHSRPIKPHRLGIIGKQHLLARFESVGAHKETFRYQKATGEIRGLPWIIETAFGYCPGKFSGRRIITGVNFSVRLGNPFRSFGGNSGEGLEALLSEFRAGSEEPIVLVLHYVCPRVEYTDRGKTALFIPE